MDYQFLTNLIALIIQLFLVSRIFKWVGVGGALLFLPLLALGGYALISFGAVFLLVRWVKALENGTDYSLQNTTKAALFLVTQREEKYKAKAAIDTFFVRGGDTVSALAVFVGTQLLGFRIERYALLNVVVVVVCSSSASRSSRLTRDARPRPMRPDRRGLKSEEGMKRFGVIVEASLASGVLAVRGRIASAQFRPEEIALRPARGGLSSHGRDRPLRGDRRGRDQALQALSQERRRRAQGRLEEPRAA